jgi:gluconolactonase
MIRSATIEWYIDKDSSLLAENAIAQVIATGYNWSEGPVWVDGSDMLLFSDVPENKIYQWTKDKGVQLYLAHSGFTDTLDHPGQDGSNGLTVDNEGRLIFCQSGARQISRMNSSLQNPAKDFTTLAGSYNGKKFNSPNDLVIDRKDNIYFTDPVYGLPGKETDPSRQLNFEGIFRISAAGVVTLLIDSISKPNGIALSADEKTLYIASSDEKKPAWYAYRLDSSGNILSGGLLLDALALRKKATVKQSPDGLKTDNFGNIFSAGPDGICIISAAGKLVGLIKVPGRYTSNCSFNNSRDILYITADDLILQLIMHPDVAE